MALERSTKDSSVYLLPLFNPNVQPVAYKQCGWGTSKEEKKKNIIAEPSTGKGRCKACIATLTFIEIKEEMRSKNGKVTPRKAKIEIENVKMSSKVVAGGLVLDEISVR